MGSVLFLLPSTLWVKLAELMASLGPRALSSLSDEARVRFIGAVRRLLRFAQTGFDVSWEYNVSSPSLRASIATLIRANVFKPWASLGWDGRTAEELTEMSGSGAEVELIGRLLDALAGQNLIIKTGDRYQGWKGSWADDLVRDPAIAGHYLGFIEWAAVPMNNLPRYLAKTGFKNPTDTKYGNFQDLHGAGAVAYHPPLGEAAVFEKLKSMLKEDQELKSLFAENQDINARLDELVDAKRTPLIPEWAQHMSDFMESHSRYNHRSWTELFPTASILQDAKPDRVLVVDIGGGKGHDALRFAELHPHIPDGSVVVQDLPHVINAASTFDGQTKVVARAYDYLEPQPVKGARVYYIHVVLHNLDDKRAVAVLKNVVEAMEKGYSQLLIHESVMSVEDPHANATSQDLFMMGMFAAQERTRDRWASVIKLAGLAICDIKAKKGFPDAVIVTKKI